jgi:hypothetical protein
MAGAFRRVGRDQAAALALSQIPSPACGDASVPLCLGRVGPGPALHRRVIGKFSATPARVAAFRSRCLSEA